MSERRYLEIGKPNLFAACQNCPEAARYTEEVRAAFDNPNPEALMSIKLHCQVSHKQPTTTIGGTGQVTKPKGSVREVPLPQKGINCPGVVKY